jgi:CMP-N,N'-diacetyllegionaminic acid synthase
MDQLEILAIIPARGGSKGIYKKNIKHLAGEPLIGYTARAAMGSKLLSKIILSTDDPEIAKIGESYGLEVPFMRPDYLAQDNSPSLSVIDYTVRELEKTHAYTPSVIVILQPTSPFRDSNQIDEAIQIFLDCKPDSLVSVVGVPHNMIPESIMQLSVDGKLQAYKPSYDQSKNSRQLKPKYYARNGASIYIVSYDCMMNKQSLFGEDIIPYFMDKISSIDIDDLEDWSIAELLMKGRKACL